MLPLAKIIQAPLTASIASSHPLYSDKERAEVIAEIKTLLKEKDAVLIAHYYVSEDIQKLAEETGGYVSDSLDMAKFGSTHPASTLVIAGVRFMGETAKILNPEKTVLMPTLEAECSLDIGCNINDFEPFCAQHPDRKIVVYSNTSAEVKAIADIVVTSSIAVDVVNKLKSQGEKIIWAPDKHLGNYIKKVTGADMLLWNASCIVHDEFKSRALGELIEKHPDAAILVHPESPEEIIEAADVVGSTSQLIQAAKTLPNKELIVATDKGIFYKMQQEAPDKTLIPAPTFGEGGTCTSCAHCPWMEMNGLHNLRSTLQDFSNEITVDEKVRVKALKSTQRMLTFLDDA